MPFQPRREGTEKAYKTIYLSKELIDRVEAMAAENHSSFNSIVVSMIEYCLNEESEG